MAGSKHTTSGSDLDVEGVDAELLASGSDVLSSQHGSVGGGLVTIGLDLHTTSDSADGFTAAGITQVSHRTIMYRANPALSPFQGLTNLRSVTWTKVSLKEAKIRATPKTSSPEKTLSAGIALLTSLANSYPHGQRGPRRCSPGERVRASWEAF